MAQHYQLGHDEFVGLVFAALRSEQFVQLVLSQPVGGKTAEISKVSVRIVKIKQTACLQFATQKGNQESHQNLDMEAAQTKISQLFGEQFRRAHLFTTARDLEAKAKGSGIVKCLERPPSKSTTDRVTAHNRSKEYLIPEGRPCGFLREIGVMNDAGQVRAKKQDKFRQINRYLEFVNDIVSSLASDGVLRVVDFGCGKSYLTFALHHLLADIHGRQVEIVGLDLKAEVIEHCNQIASRLNCRGLTFQHGDIREHAQAESIDMCVSLHACDTATDAALSKAIAWNATAILAVPCCQHELASKMTSDFAGSIQKHGIHKERLATMATDSLRALALEANGYRTQVLEFIDTEHTPKNVLIRAVKRKQVQNEVVHQRVSDYQQLKKNFGVAHLATDVMLPETTTQPDEVAG
jgi:SAM-dependent methyltransferase